MDNNNKRIAELKELRELITKAKNKATEMGATSKKTTLDRMIDVINFDLYKLGETGTPATTPGQK